MSGSQTGSIASGSCSNIEEDYGVVKSGFVTAATFPVKKERVFYAVLSERALEFHESEKHYRRKKTPKHIIDLATAFNVHNDHLDTKLRRCLCLMAPDDTFVMKCETKPQTDEWYVVILRCLLSSRSQFLGRPVFASEMFENSWDVDVVTHMKNKKHREMAGYINMIYKIPRVGGKRRICFYPHAVIVANKLLEPTDGPESGFPPFHEDGYIELPRTFVAFFGVHEKYFFLRMGRGSVMGGCELLCHTESEEMAQEIHCKLGDLIDRETAKKRKAIGKQLRDQYAQRQREREQAHRKNEQEEDDEEKEMRSLYDEGSTMESLSVPTPMSLPNSVRERRGFLQNYKDFLTSFEEDVLTSTREDGPSGSLTNLQADLHLRRTGSIASQLARKPSDGVSPLIPLANRLGPVTYHSATQLHKENQREKEREPFHNPFATNPSSSMIRRQSNTIRLVREEEGLLEAMRQANLSTYRYADAPSGVDKSKKRKTSMISKSSSVASASNSIMESMELEEGEDLYMYPVTPKVEEKTGFGGKKTPESIKGREIITGDDKLGISKIIDDEAYSMMEATEWTQERAPNSLLSVNYKFPVPVYKLEEVRAYIGDSVDSCYDSMGDKNSTSSSNPSGNPTEGGSGTTPPRANSFGGTSVEVQKSAQATKKNEKTKPPKANLAIPSDDPRKRAFSVGSKSFLNFLPDFRKLVKKQVLARPSSPNTSASGLSLTSSAASPASTSTHYLMSDLDDIRHGSRSGSFGSGRSSPFGRPTYMPPPATGEIKEKKEKEDIHVEFDFGTPGFRSGSGSIPSMDGSSRHSSFGCAGIQKHDILYSHFHEHGLYDIPIRPSEIALARARPDGDYVLTDPSKFNSQAPAELARLMEPRSSKVFETIQENSSIKSSRSSSRASVGPEDEIAKRPSYSSPMTSPSTSKPYPHCVEFALKPSFCSSIAEEKEDGIDSDYTTMGPSSIEPQPNTKC